MAKPLDERIAAAMSEGARAATVSGLIDEVAAEIEAAQAEHDRLDALSKSAIASESEADKAADDACKLARKVIRLTAKRDQLQARHDELLNSDRRRRAIEEHAAAKERRDRLVVDLRTDGARIIAELVALVERIKASDDECAAINRTQAYGLEWLDTAEAEARGCTPIFRRGGVAPIPRLVNMKIPTFDASSTSDLAWPRPNRSLAQLQEMETATRQRVAAQREAEAARWKRYLVEPPLKSGTMVSVEHQRGTVGIYREPKILTLSPELADAARDKGCLVRFAADNESVGLPSAVAVI